MIVSQPSSACAMEQIFDVRCYLRLSKCDMRDVGRASHGKVSVVHCAVLRKT